jgi:hypothetical protein
MKVPNELHDDRAFAQGGALANMGRMVSGGRLETLAAIGSERWPVRRGCS